LSQWPPLRAALEQIERELGGDADGPLAREREPERATA